MSRRIVIDRRAPPTPPAAGSTRREAIAALLGAAAATMSACSRPRGVIEPFADDPTAYSQGETQRYATTLTLGGFGRGVVGLVRDGRPFKLEGNPRHPASLGATDVFAEAAVLDLFDPQRSKAPWSNAGPTSWEALASSLSQHLGRDGEGSVLLTGRVTSPSVLAALERAQRRYPGLRHVRYEPIHDDAEMAGARLAFGRPLSLRPRIADAEVVVCLSADPLGAGPEQVANAQAFARRRRPEGGPVSRWYVFEPSLTLSGACADQRAALRPELVGNVALLLADGLGGPEAVVELPPRARAVALAAARDLAANRGRALVLTGPGQPAAVHAFAAWLNAQLQAPMEAITPVDPEAEPHAEGLAGLAADLHAGRVRNLISLECNPAYDAPGELGFVDGLRRASLVVHAGLYRDETADCAAWHAPLSHALESWGDARGPDGTASLSQPLVETLYDTRTAGQFLDLLGAPTGTAALDLVQEAWRDAATGDFDRWWRRTLIEGLVAGTAAVSQPLPAARRPTLAPASAGPALTLTLLPSATVWDGSRAPNAWLQECPDPLTKEVWGASLRLGREDAARLGIQDGERVQLSAQARTVEAAAHIVTGQAPGVVTLPLGGGRAGGAPSIASGLGANASTLRRGLGWEAAGVTITGTGERRPTPATPSDIRLDGELATLFPVMAPDERRPRRKTLPSLLPTSPPLPQREHAWGMVIDTSACIGCNACVVACQAENNIPVIGPEEILAHRDMHWLRVDRYDTGEGEDPRPGFQPVPCMQCEAAPCEPVCPVEASVHDSEGLNVQVYNRCIGTRFCEANCPYKVRRFNFRDYAEPRVYPVDDAHSVEAQRNPEVSVRARGVMEKCTYCVQRVSAARRESEKTGRSIGDGDVKTACQQACPTEAIVFGDVNDLDSEVSRLKRSGRHYVLLEELGTRPRTTYLAKVRTPPGEDG